MRYYLILLLLAVLGCKPSDGNTSEVSQNTPTPVSWVAYKGGDQSRGKQIVLVSGDEEYRSEEALPQLAKILSERHGFDCTVLFAQNPDHVGLIDPNYRFNIPGLQMLAEADLVVWFTRFRELPETQMKHLEDYLLKGKPIIAIRTATHAFNIENENHEYAHYSWNYEGDNKSWQLGLGKKILGETWYRHHGDHKQQSTRGIVNGQLASHPILNGIENGSIWGPTDVYGIRKPMLEGTKVLIFGQTVARTGAYDENDLFYGMRESDTILATSSGPSDAAYNPNKELQPIVWLNPYKIEDGETGLAFTSTIGAATDMLDEEVRRLFVNASYFLLDLEVPKKLDVRLVGKFNPTQYGFHTDDYWKVKNLRVSDFEPKTKN